MQYMTAWGGAHNPRKSGLFVFRELRHACRAAWHAGREQWRWSGAWSEDGACILPSPAPASPALPCIFAKGHLSKVVSHYNFKIK